MSRHRLLLLFLTLALLLAVLAVLQTRERPAPPSPPPATQEAAATPAPAGGSVHLALGNPSGAVSDPARPDNYLISRDQYALAYHRDRGTPLWVSWHLAASDLGTVERYSGPFIPDTTLPAGWYQVQHRDYTGSGYDRGHMVPSADRTASPADNQATFILTNVVPQAPANNQGPWAELEDHLRDLVRDGNEAYLVAGPLGTAGTLAGGALTVPAALWKVAVVLPAGEDDLARITAQTDVIAVLMPNDATVEGRSWEEYVTTVGCIEARTGFDLLAGLPDPVEQALAGAPCPPGGAAASGPAPGTGGTQAPGVSIAGVEYDPPGEDLAGEYVLLRNSGAEAATLTGWTLEDAAGATYTFPVFTLAPRAEVRVWVRDGRDAGGDLFWGRTQPVWNNSGDTAILRDALGIEVSRFTYP
ncbi:MAG TPA: DNA/RNA non-specific endonuclease [Roseiflexaceae bacterium]|nr:DNA/RNA non-specific endonuclease [Roseiflexaceae bacterium]